MISNISGRIKLILRSMNDWITNCLRVFLLEGLFDFMLVPVSQWGKASQATCERIAIGIPIRGSGMLAARARPIMACPVAVIQNRVPQELSLPQE